ncbi:MAG: HAMP domain-containing sensor histidine kinase [Bacteroidetes bacterium]|nr:HAMP domain-containing sensor histidine kinase [Bacteroidota bacterium]MDA0888436.1 HAMP domain-containing sensor histidine kinase [Bacteroidota bacterium]MDA1084496.1 HAMP domain-containing sensor histidine kinase [Bacteroidota bacterium]
MRKNLFTVLVVFMCLSLLGIIIVQTFWIQTNLNNRDRQFSLSVNNALASVSEQIKERELRDYIAATQKLMDSIGSPKESQLTEVFQYIDRTTEENKTLLVSSGIIEDTYEIFPNLYDPTSSDSTPILDYRSIKATTVLEEDVEGTINRMSSAERIQRIERLSSMDKAKYESIFMDIAANKSIEKRVSTFELELLLGQELLLRDIDASFEFRVFEGNRMSGLGTDLFLQNINNTTYKTPLFVDINGDSSYELRLIFPDKSAFLRSSVLNSIALSVFFTLILIGVFTVTLLQAFKQKKISEIKSDFINNMTHEFKTPIATIQLALDALATPVIAKKPDKVTQYLGLIRDESRRMNTQVENVLQISRLDRKELELTTSEIDPHRPIKTAIEHVRLLIDQNEGTLRMSFDPMQVKLNMSESHMTNVWVNLLENAIKYSKDRVEIDVTTSISEDAFVVQIEDQGIGMSNSVRKRVFDRFYREESGNIHNVKGHGLGLSYVKRIVELHNGTISVSSQLKKGSAFTVRFPLKHAL